VTWRFEPLHQRHDRNSFDCGEPALNNYLAGLAGQHGRKDISRTFVAVSESEPGRVRGFYTISAGEVALERLPDKVRKSLPPHYPVPMIRIGRLAVDRSFQGSGLGKALLMEALLHCARLSGEVGVALVVVDAKNDRARNFYLKFGFLEMLDSPSTLFLPMNTVRNLLAPKGQP
jgi:GNAT superfamily N-acetyltransferase